jgi:hypothetical protein
VFAARGGLPAAAGVVAWFAAQRWRYRSVVDDDAYPESCGCRRVDRGVAFGGLGDDPIAAGRNIRRRAVVVGIGGMARRSALSMSRRRRAGLVVVVAAVSVAWAAPAVARWRLVRAGTSSIAYNQGVAFDQTRNEFFFDGISSGTNSALSVNVRRDAQRACIARTRGSGRRPRTPL